VNIALVCEGSPIAGVVYAPAMRTLWAGARMGGAERAAKAHADPAHAAPPFAAMRPIHARRPPVAGLVALVSRSHASPRAEAFLAGLPIAGRRDMGSSLKFCLLAEGEADVYPRLSPTMEWDTAAGDAVLRAAGGATFDESGAALRYGKAQDNFRNSGFVAWGAPPA